MRGFLVAKEDTEISLFAEDIMIRLENRRKARKKRLQTIKKTWESWRVAEGQFYRMLVDGGAGIWTAVQWLAPCCDGLPLERYRGGGRGGEILLPKSGSGS